MEDNPKNQKIFLSPVHSSPPASSTSAVLSKTQLDTCKMEIMDTAQFCYGAVINMVNPGKMHGLV